MILRIEYFETLPNLLLRVKFSDGRVVIYDAGEDARDIPSYASLSTLPGLFARARLDQGRTCIFWNDEIELDGVRKRLLVPQASIPQALALRVPVP